MDRPYRIEFTRRALKSFQFFPRKIQQRLKSQIEKLSLSPRPSSVKKLSDSENLYRVRVGDYRILYEIQDRLLLVLVVEIGHRREIYRR